MDDLHASRPYCPRAKDPVWPESSVKCGVAVRNPRAAVRQINVAVETCASPGALDCIHLAETVDARQQLHGAAVSQRVVLEHISDGN